MDKSTGIFYVRQILHLFWKGQRMTQRQTDRLFTEICMLLKFIVVVKSIFSIKPNYLLITAKPQLVIYLIDFSSK